MDRDTLDPIIAIILTAGAVWYGVQRVLPGRRIYGGKPPLPQLAVGARVPVAPALYPGGQRSRALTVMMWLGGALTLGCGVAAAAGADRAVFTGLGLSFGIITATFAFSQWFAGRVYIRVDRIGLHTRLMFGEQTLRWNEVSGLSVRYVTMRSHVRLVYLCVQSPNREVAFPTSMQGAATLRATIEAATGQTWPVA